MTEGRPGGRSDPVALIAFRPFANAHLLSP